jgi:hypothetical protein
MITGTLIEASRILSEQSAYWSAAATSLHNDSTRLSSCDAARFSAAGVAVATPHDPRWPVHARLLSHQADQVSGKLSATAHKYSQLSDLAARVGSLYSTADDTMSTLITNTVASGAASLPLPVSAGATVALGASAFLAGGGGRKGEIASKLLKDTDSLQEGILKGLGESVVAGGNFATAGLTAGAHKAPVNEAASLLAALEAPAEALVLGNTLVVTEPHPTTDPLSASHSIDDALANLDHLTAADSGIDYGTVAVQK